MVGRKKHSSRNYYTNVRQPESQARAQPINEPHSGADFSHAVHRPSMPNSNGMCRNGMICGVDGDCSAVTATFRRRAKYSSHVNVRNQQMVMNNNNPSNMNGSCTQRSTSREAESASASSVISGEDPTEDCFLSGSGQELESDDPRLSEHCSVASMTEKTEICSVGTQTHNIKSDALLEFHKLLRWQRIEALAEIVQCLNEEEQRYIGCCIEAAVRSNSSKLRQHEMRYNDARYVENLIESLSWSHLLETAFPIISLMHSTNRQAAQVYMRLIDKIFDEICAPLSTKTVSEREELSSTLRLILTAALHHSAFSVEHKIKLDSIRSYMETAFPQSCSYQNIETSEESIERVNDPPVVISKLEAKLTDGEAVPNIYSIEIVWSDSRTSFIVRTADQISDLHNHLLDTFPNESGAQTENPRVLPYLNRLQPESIMGYIRALPDLPARVLVNPVVQSFFYPSKLESCSLSTPPQSLLLPSLPLECPPSSSSSSAAVPMTLNQSIGPTMPCAIVPVSSSLGNVAPPAAACAPLLPVSRPLQLIAGSGYAYQPLLALPPNPNGMICCNCSGRHPFTYCNQPTMLQVIASGEYRLDYNCTTNSAPVELTPSIVTVNSAVSPSPNNYPAISPSNYPMPLPSNYPAPPLAPNSF